MKIEEAGVIENGRNSKETPKEVDEKGKFNRQGNRFSTPFGDGPDELPVEAGRYRLVWSGIFLGLIALSL